MAASPESPSLEIQNVVPRMHIFIVRIFFYSTRQHLQMGRPASTTFVFLSEMKKFSSNLFPTSSSLPVSPRGPGTWRREAGTDAT